VPLIFLCWVWRLLTEKGGMWYRVLKARYGEVGGGLEREGETRRCGGRCCVVSVMGLMREWGTGLRLILGG